MLTRIQKEEQVAELKEKFGRATCIYVMGYRGLDVQSANALRRQVRIVGDGDFEYRVAKNSVLKLASADSDCSVISSHFAGPTSVAISYGDPVGLAKILSEFAEDNEGFELRAGVVDGEPVDPAQISVLAKLPSLDALRGTLVGLIAAPATRLVRLLAEPGSQLARLVEAHKCQLEVGGAA